VRLCFGSSKAKNCGGTGSEMMAIDFVEMNLRTRESSYGIFAEGTCPAGTRSKTGWVSIRIKPIE